MEIKILYYKIFLVVLFSFLLFACGGKEDENGNKPPVAQEFDLAISHSSVSIVQENTFLLSATVSPEAPEHPVILWSSSNSAIASVDNTGLVSGLSVGEAMITAIFADSTRSVTCKVTVCAPSNNSYTVTLNKTSAKLINGNVLILMATINLQPSEGIQLTWYSSNPGIATVNANGEVKGVNAGKVNIIAKLSDGTESEPCVIVVYPLSNYDYKYRLILKDKGFSAYSVNRPEEFLSQKSIQRRNIQKIAIDETDLPISDEYMQAINAIGGTIAAKSKWLNTVCVHCDEPYMADEYKELPFIEDVVLVWRGAKTSKQSAVSIAKLSPKKVNVTSTPSRMGAEHYGAAWGNIEKHNGKILHDSGFKGNGIDVAVIDAGYTNFPAIAAMGNIKVKGAKSFIFNDDKVYNNTHDHGTWVTTCMAFSSPGKYVGSAPEASYWLLRSEDANSEYPVEEDYWVAAMEFADSVGVDVTNTSVGYKTYDSPAESYRYSDSDGKTALMSRGADMAVAKGIFVVCSAGNSGDWVSTPGDAKNVLTVGSIGTDGNIASGSCRGNTVDGRIKPDVVALGNPACVIGVDGKVEYLGGTSFSSPIVCGLVVCLRQAYPTLTSIELLDVIRKSGDRCDNPLLPYGYGIPDMQKAMQLARGIANSK